MKDVRAWLAKCVLVALLSLLHAPQLVAQSAGWQKIWDETLAAARKEGKVVVVGSPDPVFRNEIIPTFRSKFGIEIEAIFGSSGPLAERARMERASGIRYLDVFMPGPSTAMYNLEAEHLLDPIKPLLLLPEVADHSKWKLGRPHFIDAGEQNVLMLFRNVESFLFVNEDYVKPGELKTLDDLLNPKWAGKIETQDPLGSGTASDLSAYFYTEKGPDFVRKLFVDQKPVIREDRRQLMDSLARGTTPICLTCKIEHARELQREGYKIREIFELEGSKQRITTAPFVLTLIKDAPHPNAARIFINWMATKEALEIYSRGNGTATLRTDADESFLNPEIIPKRDGAYFDATASSWILGGRPTAMQKARQVIKGQ
jgi:iron(III) transport system substrate-binding protein